MKALIVKSPGTAVFEEVPTPVPQDDQLLVKVVRAGICGTDNAIYTGNSSFVRSGLIKYPVRIGHEWSGVVERVGKAVTRFKPGDRVVSDNGVSCGNCPACREQRYGECSNGQAVGTVNCWDGCFADYILMPERHVYPIADHVSFEMAALAEPLSVANDGFRNVRLHAGSIIAVIGTGPIGMSAVALAKYYGAGKIIMVGRRENKLAVAAAVGATDTVNATKTDAAEAVRAISGGRGADLALEISGSEAGLVSAINMTAPNGIISVIGFYEKDVCLPIDRLVVSAINLQSATGAYGNLEAVANIMGQYDLALEPVITHRVRFDDCIEYLKNEEKYHNDKIKVMVEFD